MRRPTAPRAPTPRRARARPPARGRPRARAAARVVPARAPRVPVTDRGPGERAGRCGRGRGQLATVGGPERRRRGPRSAAAGCGGSRRWGRRCGGRRPCGCGRSAGAPEPPVRRAALARQPLVLPEPPVRRAALARLPLGLRQAQPERSDPLPVARVPPRRGRPERSGLQWRARPARRSTARPVPAAGAWAGSPT